MNNCIPYFYMNVINYISIPKTQRFLLPYLRALCLSACSGNFVVGLPIYRAPYSPVAINAIFCPAESPGGAGGMSYTAARDILLQFTRLSPAVVKGFPDMKHLFESNCAPRFRLPRLTRRIYQLKTLCNASQRGRVLCSLAKQDFKVGRV